MRLPRGFIVIVLSLIANTAITAFSADLSVTSFSSFAGETNILLHATGDIIFEGGSLVLPALPPGASAGQLQVQAQNDIVIQDGASISAGVGWSVSLLAGANINRPGTFNPGLGNITFQGAGQLQTQDGSITLLAGNNVTVSSGAVTTLGGGNINVTAAAGNVNTGANSNGFLFRSSGSGYVVNPNLGGVSTAAGGDVNITAGQDIISYLPVTGSPDTDGGSGAFGPQAGNVTLTAGYDVVGHFVVANGAGTINADNDAGTGNTMLALSLVSGGWLVNAGQEIALQEVRNPNGIFNALGPGTSPTKHFFDFASIAFVDLNAGTSVTFFGLRLPRNSGEQSIPPIYPPTLNVSAGAGGIVMVGSVLLFPSPVGQLNLSTTNGGSLEGASSPGANVQLVMSDSSASQYTSSTSFGPDDHAATPVHLNDLAPVQLDISGDMSAVMLVSPKPADVNLGGNMIGGQFITQNLHPGDVSSLFVAGDILTNAPSGSPSTSSGCVISGPGALHIAANDLDLAGPTGLQSVGPFNHHALAALGPSGADIQVNLAGTLNLFGAAIASIAGGQINVLAQGDINLGSTNLQNDNNAALGIFTSAKADVSVIAAGGINLTDSRIAAYDGGNILVGSIDGNVDASIPGDTSMSVTEVSGNQASSAVILGNGILATTFPNSTQRVGNITVLAAQDILLGCGAITQAPLNGTFDSAALVTLQAGGDVVLATNDCVTVSGVNVDMTTVDAPVFLNSQLNVSNLTAVAGTNVQFTVTAEGLAPFTYQWFKNGSNLPGATNTLFSLTNIHRADAAVYSVTVSNPAGTMTNDVQLHVLVPQSLSASFVPTDDVLSVSFSDADGGLLRAQDIASFVIQTSANLVDWTPTNLPISTNASGGLLFQLPVSSAPSVAFYRILSE